MTRAFLTMGMGTCTWFQGGSPDGARDGSFFLNWSIVKDCSDAQSGEGNGNPLQYSCLENPMDGGAWCPWGRKGSDTTKQLHFHFHSNNIYVFSSKYSFSCIPQFMVCIITVIKPVYITVSNARKFSFPIPLHMPLSPQNQNALSNYF